MVSSHLRLLILEVARKREMIVIPTIMSQKKSTGESVTCFPQFSMLLSVRKEDYVCIDGWEGLSCSRAIELHVAQECVCDGLNVGQQRVTDVTQRLG